MNYNTFVMNNRNLKSEMILKKKFDTELSGYSAKDVDEFLDLILSDYKSFEEDEKVTKEKINELNEIINDKNALIDALKLENQNLQEQKNNLANNTSAELHKRVLALERRIKNKERK